MWIIDSFRENVAMIYDTARTSPGVFFPILAVGLVLIWLKWYVISKATAKSQKDNFAGWTVDGHADATTHQIGIGQENVLVMKPVKLLSLSLWCLLFFGGGALFWFLVEYPKGNMAPKEKFSFGIMACFALGSLYTLFLSFDRIRLFADRIERTRLFGCRFSAPLSSVAEVSPISKTIAGGVFVTFNDGRKLRVIPRMSGYRQMLERLSQQDPKLRLLVSMSARHMKDRL